MHQVRKSLLLSLGAVLAVVAVLWGCNGSDIDDAEDSDSLLVVQSVQPASVEADVSPSINADPNDPNSGLLFPPPDDVVTVSVENVLRNQSAAGIFNDILITNYDIVCANGSLQLAGSTTGIPASITVPASSTSQIQVVVAQGPYKEANAGALLAIGTDTCSIVFKGQDLGGEPVVSTRAIVVMSYIDTP